MHRLPLNGLVAEMIPFIPIFRMQSNLIACKSSPNPVIIIPARGVPALAAGVSGKVVVIMITRK
jgi:hypothetical protein